MQRSIWIGSISFGLVSVPVRMHSATDEHDLHPNLIHARDGSRIDYQKICKAEGEPEPADLLAALRASVEAAQRSREPARAKLAPVRKAPRNEAAKR